MLLPPMPEDVGTKELVSPPDPAGAELFPPPVGVTMISPDPGGSVAPCIQSGSARPREL